MLFTVPRIAFAERGFARWRQHPERITGFYARNLEGEVPQYHCTQCERHTYASGQYNVVLTGAAFLDVSAFDLYNAPANKQVSLSTSL